MPAWWFVTDVWMDLSLMHQRDNDILAAAALQDEADPLAPSAAAAGVSAPGVREGSAASHGSGRYAAAGGGAGKAIARTYVGQMGAKSAARKHNNAAQQHNRNPTASEAEELPPSPVRRGSGGGVAPGGGAARVGARDRDRSDGGGSAAAAAATGAAQPPPPLLRRSWCESAESEQVRPPRLAPIPTHRH